MSHSALGPVLRFHLRVGARIAMILLAPVLTATVGGGMLLGVDFLNSFSRMLYGSGSSGGAALLIALACLGVASAAAPRICRGLDGWLRHLPVDGRAHRRAAAAAIAVAQTPLLLLLLLLSLVATQGSAASVIDALALPVTALGAALWAAPAERGALAKILGLGAAIAAGSGGWGLLVAGIALLVVGDRVAGGLEASSAAPRSWLAIRPIRPIRPIRRITQHRRGYLPPWLAPALFSARLSWRALRWKLVSAYFGALLPLGGAWAFVSHNELAPKHVILGTLLGGGIAVVFLFSQLGETLAALRPAWPWSRSLPWSATGRVIADAAFLAAHALPLLILAVFLHPMALVLFGLTPFLAVRAAGAMRRAPERRTGASGEILLEGLPAAAATALLPWVALPLLAMTPLAIRWAAERERRQKVSRWLELHHLAVGDSQSWSA